MQIAISAYQYRLGKLTCLVPVVPGLFDWSVQSGDPGKARQRLIERVRKEVPKLDRRFFARLHAPTGRRLSRVHLQLTLEDDDDKRSVAGFFPVVLEERESGVGRGFTIAYHPLAPANWFEPGGDVELTQELARHYARLFEPADGDRIKSNGTEKLITLRFHVDLPSMRGLLRSKKEHSELVGAGVSGDLSALMRVTVNQSARAANGELELGLPRERERQRLSQLLGGRDKSPVLVVGAPGCGKSALIAQAVYDLLAADDYPSHGNLDRVRNVIAVSGRQIIAGMSYVGQWEARCVELLARCKQRRLILWVDDFQAFPRIGKSSVSERSLADFFRGPLARRELTLIAECTPEGLVALDREAPGLVSAFTRVDVGPVTPAEATSMMLHEVRRLERADDLAFDPRCFQSLLEQSAALASSLALPGRALTPLKALSKDVLRRPTAADQAFKEVTPSDVVGFFSAQTGLPQLLLAPDAPLNRARLLEELSGQVMGQPDALEAIADVILSLRCKLCGPGRPYGVYLFTGPTGTGKTELAKCMTDYLYGSQQRLLRFDMGEFNGPDAVSRLIGDSYTPLGLLTSTVRAQPFCVLLFDEVEKAHPAVLNLMLQIFEDARLTDAQGQVTDFTHSVVVLTSNLGTAGKSVRGFAEDTARQTGDIARAVREFFPPELFNRIDRVVPFAPLSRASALQIVQKQLKLLAARPGLSERSTFVRFTDAVVARVVQAGYDAEYGARALKRYIDREIAASLTDSINAEGASEMRLLWLYAEESGSGVGVRTESLREAQPDSAPNALGWLFEQDFSELRRRLPETLAKLVALESDPRMLALGRQLSAELDRYRLGDKGRADQIFTLDSIFAHARTVARRLELLLHSDSELEALERQRKLSYGVALEDLDYSTTFIPFMRHVVRERRLVPLDVLRSSTSARELVRDLAEVALIEGLLARAHEPDRHVVTIEITRLSLIHEQRRFAAGSPGLCEWLASLYASARGELDAAAISRWDGTVSAIPAYALASVLDSGPRQVVLRLVGPGVADYFEREHGCHVRRTLASGPEIVRVQVRAGDHDPLAWVQRHRAKLVAFEEGLEGRGPMVDNPEALLPVIRSLRFDPLADEPAVLRVEDYRLLYAAQRRVRRVEDLLSDLLLIGAGARSEAAEDPPRA